MIDRYRTTQGRHARRLDGGPEGGWDLPADVGKEGITILANIAVNPRARTGRDAGRKIRGLSFGLGCISANAI